MRMLLTVIRVMVTLSCMTVYLLVIHGVIPGTSYRFLLDGLLDSS